MGIKALYLPLIYTWERKNFCLFLKIWNWSKIRTITYQRLFLSLTHFTNLSKLSSNFLYSSISKFKIEVKLLSSKSSLIKFGIKFASKNSSCSNHPPKFKLKKVDYLLKNQQILINYIQKIQFSRWENLQRCYLFFFLFLFISAIFRSSTANNLWSLIFAISFVLIFFTYLDDLSP